MKNKRLSEQCCKHQHLPEELWPEILSRLPAKALVRFLCVSKSWLSLISDPDFCRLHLENFKNNVDETRLLVLEGIPNNCVLRCSKTFETKSATLLPIDSKTWEVECIMDGLVLLKCHRWNHTRFRHLQLWNPSIRKSHDFPPLPGIKTYPFSLLDDAEIGLGYDPLVKDYKHVKLLFKSNRSLHSVAVYTLRARSWKIIAKKFCNWHWRLREPALKSVYLQGCLYLFACDEDTNVLEVVSVDLSSEMFSSISLPGVVHTGPFSTLYEGQLTLVDGGCSVAVCEFRHDRCMWVLENESMTWTKRYSFDMMVDRFLYYKKNGDLLLWCCKKMSYRLATDMVFAKDYALVSSYNLESRREEVLQQKEYGRSELVQVCGYVESLILLK